MKNIFSKISLFAAGVILATACSKTPYASFGGGPKKLTAEPQARNIYANAGDEYKRVRPVSVVTEQSPAVENQAVSSEQITQAIQKVEKQATASAKKMTLGQKISMARQAYKLKKEVQKAEAKAEAAKVTGGKSQLIALLLSFGFLIGICGIHRFYLGYIGAGIIQLLTFGLCGIWTLIDIIRLATGDLKPKDGEYDETL